MLGFLSYLLFLELIMIKWFSLIIRIAINVVRGDGAADVRSDEEEEEGEEDDDVEYEEAQPFEEEVGVDAIDLTGWKRRTNSRVLASSSGVSLPGHIDREILNRIGCEQKIE